MRELKDLLESLYKKLNKRGLVDPDPLKFLYDYPDIKDREITGLVASSLAYGRVAQILKSVDKILLPMEGKPFDFVTSHNEKDLTAIYRGFVHRFTTDADIVRIRGLRKPLSLRSRKVYRRSEHVEKIVSYSISLRRLGMQKAQSLFPLDGAKR